MTCGLRFVPAATKEFKLTDIDVQENYSECALPFTAVVNHHSFEFNKFFSELHLIIIIIIIIIII